MCTEIWLVNSPCQACGRECPRQACKLRDCIDWPRDGKIQESLGRRPATKDASCSCTMQVPGILPAASTIAICPSRTSSEGGEMDDEGHSVFGLSFAKRPCVRAVMLTSSARLAVSQPAMRERRGSEGAHSEITPCSQQASDSSWPAQNPDQMGNEGVLLGQAACHGLPWPATQLPWLAILRRRWAAIVVHWRVRGRL
ncbi:hypothetical protein BD289DRAFT_426488 [Coniella lustricola]|uniref:Uncharacterized protein n=1 Tax=Coniella lustricola TaxID=2025994 RepID=A0A2T3AG19_9PEZI|nr:hypothetical protein BD289DRAFT_426488 [Coniella lustricola]